MAKLNRGVQLLAMIVLVAVGCGNTVLASPAMPAYGGPPIASQQSLPGVLQMRPGVYVPRHLHAPRSPIAYSQMPPPGWAPAYRPRRNNGWPIPTHYMPRPMMPRYGPRMGNGYPMAMAPMFMPPRPPMAPWQRHPLPARFVQPRSPHPGYAVGRYTQQPAPVYRPRSNSVWPVPTHYMRRPAPPTFRAWPRYGGGSPINRRPIQMSPPVPNSRPPFPSARMGYPPQISQRPVVPRSMPSPRAYALQGRQAQQLAGPGPYGFKPRQPVNRYQPRWPQKGIPGYQFRPRPLAPTGPRYGVNPQRRAHTPGRFTPSAQMWVPPRTNSSAGWRPPVAKHMRPPLPPWAQKRVPIRTTPPFAQMKRNNVRHSWMHQNRPLSRPAFRGPSVRKGPPVVWRSRHSTPRVAPVNPQFAFAPSPLQ